MKRNLAIILTILSLVGLTAPLTGCGSEKDEVMAENQIVAVQRGDLSVAITAAGNLALSRTEDLAIDLFYGQSGATGTKGTIGEVLVEEGDTVAEGQVLVTVDKDEWADQLSTLEDQVTTKERAIVTAEINLNTAEQNLQDARDDEVDNEAARKLAVLNAQISLEQAQDALDEARSTEDWTGGFSEIEAALDRAKTYYDYLLYRGTNVPSSSEDGYVLALEKALESMETAQKNYDNFVAGLDAPEISIKKKQVEAAEMSLSRAQADLVEVSQDVALKELQLTLAQGQLEDAQKALADAQEKLVDAKSKTPEIKAPFGGFITRVNVAGGDEVLNGAVAVQIADPNKFEADILVSEKDIANVKLGGKATVEVDSLPGLTLSANVTHIAPTATIQSGVVNYSVTVEIQSAPTAAVTENFQLREGLTVTVSITVQQRTDVLLIPKAAITNEGGQSYVQVVSSTGTTEKRAIKTGITDYKNTEITEGLQEGESVSIPQSTKTSTTTQQQQPGGMMIPGMGGPPPPPPGK